VRWCVVASVLINLSVAGCQRAVEPTYVFRAEVAALSPELQQAIQTELVKHSGTPLHPKLIGNEKVAQPYLDRGAMVFQQRCAGCHGTTGDGNGPAGPSSSHPRPRDYRRGIFKFHFHPLWRQTAPRGSAAHRSLRRPRHVDAGNSNYCPARICRPSSTTFWC